MNRRIVAPLLASAILLLAGCATLGNGCSWARPIYVSPNDVLTDGTAKQIRGHDETGAKICGWKRAPKHAEEKK